MAVGVVATYTQQLTVVETLDATLTPAAPQASRVVTHNQFAGTKTYNASSTPAATETVNFTLTLVAGAKTIDLADLVGSGGRPVDGTSKKIISFVFLPQGPSNMVIVPGATNGYHAFGTDFSLTAFTAGGISIDNAAGAPVIDATHKTLDVTGTGTQTAKVQIVFGL